MFHIVLLNPEIPPNTGNIIRLTANVGATLHLAGETGFDLSDRRMRRAGLDYHEYADIRTHDCLASALDAIGQGRQFILDPNGEVRFDRPNYRPGDIFIFGCESRGLPDSIFQSFPSEHRLHIPMRPNNRSLNLSNAVAVVLMEAWKQNDFSGTKKT